MTRRYVGVCRRSEILELFLGVSGTRWRSAKLTAAMSTSQTLGVPCGCLSGFPSSCTSVSWKRVSFLASGGSGNHQLPHPLGAGRGLGVQASPLNPGAGALETGTAGLLPSHLLQGAQLSLMSLEAGMHLSAPGPLGRYGSQSSLEPGEPVGVGEPADGGCSPQPPGTCRQVV